MKRVYLDWAAAAPVGKGAYSAFTKAVAAYGNPGSPHEEGRAARDILEDARTRIARLLEVKSDAVIFTSGATEANALAIHGVIGGINPHILYHPASHASVIEAVAAIPNAALEPIALKDCAVDITRFKEQLRPNTALVTTLIVCSETGVRFDTRATGRAIKEMESRAVFHVDASQLPLVESLERTRLGADLISLDAQKVGGVRGIGCLIAPRHITVTPLVHGGGQERGLRSGTPATALAAAFATALEVAQKEASAFSARASQMRADLLQEIESISDVVINEGKEQAPHIVNLSLVGRDTDYLVALMDASGFAVSTRSACETDESGSRPVLAIFGNEARAQATLRISFGPTTASKELIRFARALKKEVAFIDAHNSSS